MFRSPRKGGHGRRPDKYCSKGERERAREKKRREFRREPVPLQQSRAAEKIMEQSAEEFFHVSILRGALRGLEEEDGEGEGVAAGGGEGGGRPPTR